MYQYADNPRLQLWFFSPNICGAFLVMTALCTLGIFLWLKQVLLINKTSSNHYNKKLNLFLISSSTLIFIALFIQFLMLAATYSRGGYLSLSLTLLILWGLTKDKWYCISLLTFGLALFLTMNSFDRVVSSGAISDGSIWHRLLIWHYGSVIIVDNWLTGISPGIYPGEIYTRYYQPLWLNERYQSFLNDYMNIAVRYGIFTLFASLSCIFILIYCSVKQLLNNRKRVFLISFTGVTISFLIGIGFSSYCGLPNIFYPFLAVLFLLLIINLNNLIRGQLKIRLLDIILPLTLSASICSLIIVYGCLVKYFLPYKVQVEKFRQAQIIKFIAKQANPETIIYLIPKSIEFNQKYLVTSELRRMVRPLVRKNYSVYAFTITSGATGLDMLSTYLRRLEHSKIKKIIIMGYGATGHQALTVAAHNSSSIQAVIAVNAVLNWPFEKLSPLANIANFKAPILLLYEADTDIQSNDFQQFSNLCLKYNVPLVHERLKISSEKDSVEQSIFVVIDNFITTIP